MRKLRVIAVVGSMVLVSCAPSNAEDLAPSSTTVRDTIDYHLPDGWQVAEATLTPNLADPREVLSLGTFPLRPGGDTCAQVPEDAMEDLGPDDVLVTLQERSPPDEFFAPRPASFGPLLTGISQVEFYDCIQPSEKADIGVLVWLPFQDEGRGFYLLVVIGNDASDATRQEAVELLDSLRFG